MAEDITKESVSANNPADKPDSGGELKECQKQRDEYLAGWQRERADMLNYKKDEMERIGQIVRYATEDLILKILPILDNFERAEAEMPDAFKNEQYFKGLIQIKTQIIDLLKTFEVKAISSLGQSFNPNFHEVFGETEVKDKKPGTIIEEIQKGYTLQGGVIRPAKVRIVK